MKVLVTGASGFLGRHAIQELHRNNIGTVALSRTPMSSTEFIQTDLLDLTNVEEAVARARATHLLHLAWDVEHGKYQNSPNNIRWVESTLRLTEAFCRAGGQHVVATGTCLEYAPSATPATEDATPREPETLYGIAKDATRRLMMAACAHYKVNCAWARIYIPYGAGENPLRLVPSLISALKGDRSAFGVNRRARRDFIHALDVARALTTLLKTGAPGAYNVASGKAEPIETVVRELAAILARDPAPILELSTDRPDEPAVLAGDNDKLRSLGWSQTLSLAAGLRKAVADA